MQITFRANDFTQIFLFKRLNILQVDFLEHRREIFAPIRDFVADQIVIRFPYKQTVIINLPSFISTENSNKVPVLS